FCHTSAPPRPSPLSLHDALPIWFFTIKVASGSYANPDRGLPVGSGIVLVFDSMTGFPRAVLFDNGYLTDLRTGAAGALATDLLRSEEHTSELQSRVDLVCRLLLE